VSEVGMDVVVPWVADRCRRQPAGRRRL